jgi:hypothetical protein
VSLELFPTWSTLLLVSGSGCALFAGWLPRLAGIAALLIVGFGAVVQAFRLASLLDKAAQKPIPSGA